MDPLHPIVPVAPNIPPVTPAPIAGRIDGNPAGNNRDRDQRRRRRPESEAAAHASIEGTDYYLGDAGDDDEPGLHINVTA
ncbi:MAG TPA: hypothetical protein VLW51_05870 [Solirubrobacteraceae bacterium]|jgi:hypothetical protein|nr:hypothetical protein [Solirubrobacteraceae bacterium]